MRIFLLCVVLLLMTILCYEIGYNSMEWHREEQKWVLHKRYGGAMVEFIIFIVSGNVTFLLIFIGNYLAYDFLDKFGAIRPIITFCVVFSPIASMALDIIAYERGQKTQKNRFSISEA